MTKLRRRILPILPIVLLAAGAWALIAAAAPSAGRAPLRFAWLSDTHVGSDRGAADLRTSVEDINRQFNKNVMPQLDRMMQQSGSYGNTGIQDMQKDAMSDYTRNVGNIANDMRYKDLFSQQQLGEGDASRRTGVNLANSGAYNQASLANAGSQNAFALGRAGLLGGLSTGDLNRQLGTQEFNSTLGASDLARNSGLYQQLGMFNVGNQVGDIRQAQNLAQGQTQFNASQGNNMNQFNANQGNTLGMWNAGQGNNLNQFNAQQGNAMNTWNAGAQNAMNQYNTSNNLNSYNNAANMYGQLDNRALTGANVLGTIGGQQQGQTQAGLNAQQQQWMQQMMAPYQNLGWYAPLINSMNAGSSQSMYYPGSPWLGAFGGAMMGSNLFGGNQTPKPGN